MSTCEQFKIDWRASGVTENQTEEWMEAWTKYSNVLGEKNALLEAGNVLKLLTETHQ